MHWELVLASLPGRCAASCEDASAGWLAMRCIGIPCSDVALPRCRVFTEADGSQRLVAFSFGEALSDALITVWEYDEQWRCMHKIKRTLPGAAFGFFHDIAVTENHYVLLQVPPCCGLAPLT
jgi:hypothetical protein